MSSAIEEAELRARVSAAESERDAALARAAEVEEELGEIQLEVSLYEKRLGREPTANMNRLHMRVDALIDWLVEQRDIARKVAKPVADERQRLQRAVVEALEVQRLLVVAAIGVVGAPSLLVSTGILTGLCRAAEALGAIGHVDQERNLAQWIDRETGDVVHERGGR